nr:MAG TPA: hypothetical protein [Caudoviricetes sp.]
MTDAFVRGCGGCIKIQFYYTSKIKGKECLS